MRADVQFLPESRRHVIEYWDETHPSQLKLNPGRDRRVGRSAIGQCRKDRYGALTTPIAPHLAALVKQLETQKQESSLVA